MSAPPISLIYISLILSSGLIDVLPPNFQISTSNVREQSYMNNKEIRDATYVANSFTDFIYIMM